MAPGLWQLAFILFPALAILHLHISPYTKVEESFNIQAIHDILEYGVPIDDAPHKFKAYFDHMTFPGAVPRTFIGSALVAGLSKPEIWLGDLAGKAAQVHVRAVLGGLNATAMAFFARAIEKAYGPIAATWYVVLQASQFHLWYYASRTLPNMFAFFLSTLSLAFLLPNPTSSLGPARRTKLGLYLMTLATVVFRSELALLLGADCLWLFLKPATLDAKIALIRTTMIPSIVPGALLALALTVIVDSYFWQSPTPLWPELSAFLANVFPKEGSLGASAWGTQPFYWYLTAALPRLLMNQFLMIDFFFLFPSTWQDLRVLDSLIPSYAYILVYSILPHKETRFMFPIVPSLTLVAALTCTRLTINAHKATITQLLLSSAIISTLITAFISHAILLPLSAQNYPGGHAIQALHQHYHENWQDFTPVHQPSTDVFMPEIHVHLTNLALQTGVTRFLEQPDHLLSKNSSDIGPSISVSISRVDPSSTPYPHPNHRDPLILPGDTHHPALTIHPKIPGTPSSSPPPPLPKSANAHWVYEKSSNATLHLDPLFWSKFDFVIVEDLHHAIGAWDIVDEISALGRPRILHPEGPCEMRFNSWKWTTPDELLAYISQPDEVDIKRGGTTALLYAMYPSWIAGLLSHLHNIAHDVCRCGRGIGGRGLGYWVDVPLETKLYILRRTRSGTLPNKGTASPARPGIAQTKPAAKHEEEPAGLPEQPSMEREAMDWEKLGPLVVNKDGTLSRLDNWARMNEQERKKTVEYLRKRNLIRLEAAAV